MKRIFSPLGLGIAVPIITLIVLGLSIYLPGFFVKPTNDVVYTVNNYSGMTTGSYTMIDGKVAYTDYSSSYSAPVILEGTTPTKPKLYRYHLDTDTSEELTIDAANALNLSSSTKSPDGFTFTYDYGYRGTVFGIVGGGYGSGNYSAAIEGKGIRRVLKVDSSQNSSIVFLAWVK